MADTDDGAKFKYSVHCIQYTVFSTLYSVHCIQYTVFSTLYPVHCIQYTVLSIECASLRQPIELRVRV